MHTLVSLYSAFILNNTTSDYTISQTVSLVLTIFNEGAYLTFKSIFHKALNYFSLIVKSRLNPFLEPTSTKQ